MSAGRIIWLDGPSSSGKSSIARALQAHIDSPFWHVSIDHLRDTGVLPMVGIHSGEFRWAEMREAFFDGFERSIVGYAAAGNDLILEHIVESRAWLDRLARRLESFDLFFVGVRCDMNTLERREQARGDRPAGDARRDYEAGHAQGFHDFEVDGVQAPELSASQVIAAWRARPRPSTLAKILT